MDSATKREIDVAQAEAGHIAEDVTKLVIKTPEDMQAATSMLGKIKNFQKNIKTKKQGILGPMKIAMDEVKDLFAEAENKAATAENGIKSALLTYQEKQERKAAKKASKIEQRVDAGEMDLTEGAAKLNKVNSPDSSIKTDDGTVSFKTIRKVRITNFSELPTSYFLRTGVQAAIEKEVRNDVLKEHKPCPVGAEVYEEKQVAARG